MESEPDATPVGFSGAAPAIWTERAAPSNGRGALCPRHPSTARGARQNGGSRQGLWRKIFLRCRRASCDGVHGALRAATEKSVAYTSTGRLPTDLRLGRGPLA